MRDAILSAGLGLLLGGGCAIAAGVPSEPHTPRDRTENAGASRKGALHRPPLRPVVDYCAAVDWPSVRFLSKDLLLEEYPELGTYPGTDQACIRVPSRVPGVVLLGENRRGACHFVAGAVLEDVDGSQVRFAKSTRELSAIADLGGYFGCQRYRDDRLAIWVSEIELAYCHTRLFLNDPSSRKAGAPGLDFSVGGQSLARMDAWVLLSDGSVTRRRWELMRSGEVASATLQTLDATAVGQEFYECGKLRANAANDRVEDCRRGQWPRCRQVAMYDEPAPPLTSFVDSLSDEAELRCREGMREACVVAGYLALRWEAIDRDVAEQLVVSSCEAGDPEACYLAGELQALRAKGATAQDVELWEDACESGVGAACRRLGDWLYERGSSTELPIESFALYRQACDADDQSGCGRLVQFCHEGFTDACELR